MALKRTNSPQAATANTRRPCRSDHCPNGMLMMAITAGGYQEAEAACRHIEVHLHRQIEREQVDDAQEDDIEQQVCDEDRGELPLCKDPDVEKRLFCREFPDDKQPRAEQAERTTGKDQRVRYPTGSNLFQHKGTKTMAPKSVTAPG